MKLSDEITILKGVGPSLSGLLTKLSLKKIGDLLEHYPRRYEDYSQVTKIKDLRPGPVTIKARLTGVKGRYGKRRGLHVTEALATDATGSLHVVWFNQPYRIASIKQAEYYLSGMFGLSGPHLSLSNPTLELASSLQVNTARILPVYRETKGLTSLQLRKLMAQVRPLLADVPDPLPAGLRQQSKLLSLAQVLDLLHFPKTSQDIEVARQQLGIRELFVLALASLLLRQDNEMYTSEPIPVNEKYLRQVVENLEFEPTKQQRQVAWRALREMSEAKRPVNRLIEGDVGSGKTVIAGLLIANAIAAGIQVAFMAPTALLAQQQVRSLKQMLTGLLKPSQIVMLSGALKTAEKRQAHEAICNGTAKLVVGTHALFQNKVDYQNLQLLIIDEQHRFGVSQRKQLQKKSISMPHVVTMTATPIPRTLGLVLYGELDISILAEKPPGRLPIETQAVSLASRADKISKIAANAGSQKQAYLVCPNISSIGNQDSIEELEIYLRQRHPQLKYGVLHGKMPAEDKDQIMSKFVSGQIHLLLATTVIEVGVNVVNATEMLIIAPERFGLAQLHQLRGRVGRGNRPGRCWLLLADNQPPIKRLRHLAATNDGFRLSELDLQTRGPGAIYGTRQSGALDLRLANISDAYQVEQARNLAEYFIASDQKLLEYPELAKMVKEIQKVTILN